MEVGMSMIMHWPVGYLRKLQSLDPEYGPACEFWGWIYHKFIPSNGFLLTTSMLKI